MPKQRPVSEQERALSCLVEALIRQRIELDPWLEFPQSTCTFRFGETKKPLPIGALLRLWDTDERWRKPCPLCGSKAYGISCGGLLSMGWFEFICLVCSRFFVQNPGGLWSAEELLSSLVESEFKVTGRCFGAGIGSQGEPLLKALDLSYSPASTVRLFIK